MQPSTSQDALSQLQQYQSTAQNPNDILAAQQSQLGVNNAQQTVTGLRGAIDNTNKLLTQVAPSVMGRTASSLVTNAQASKQIQNEQAPLSQNLTTEGNQYNEANQDLGQLQQQAQTAASGIYQGQQDKESYLQNVYNTLYQKEQDAQKAAEQQAQDAAQQSQFEQTLAASKAAAGSNPLDYLNSSSGGGLPQGVSLKNTQAGGSAGYNFNFGGTPVSAAKFAQLNGGNLQNLLFNLGNSGDKTAAAALQALTKSGGKWTPAIQAQFPSIFWGV